MCELYISFSSEIKIDRCNPAHIFVYIVMKGKNEFCYKSAKSQSNVVVNYNKRKREKIKISRSGSLKTLNLKNDKPQSEG